jgi:hypothetical protein
MRLSRRHEAGLAFDPAGSRTLPTDDVAAGAATVGESPCGDGAAAVAGRDYAEAVLRRAVALPMPPHHPHRARVLVALADHLDADGRGVEAAPLREQAATIVDAALPEPARQGHFP